MSEIRKRSPEEQAAYEEGYRQATKEFALRADKGASRRIPYRTTPPTTSIGTAPFDIAVAGIHETPGFSPGITNQSTLDKQAAAYAMQRSGAGERPPGTSNKIPK